MKISLIEIESPNQNYSVVFKAENSLPRLTNEQLNKIQRDLGRVIGKIGLRLKN